MPILHVAFDDSRKQCVQRAYFVRENFSFIYHRMNQLQLQFGVHRIRLKLAAIKCIKLLQHHCEFCTKYSKEPTTTDCASNPIFTCKFWIRPALDDHLLQQKKTIALKGTVVVMNLGGCIEN